jgi:DNA replication protein DnaC
MSGSKPESKENKLPEIPEVDPWEQAVEQAKLRAEDWVRLGGVAGVGKGFAHAGLGQYPEKERKAWKDQINAGGWIFTHGPVGTGKTHLLSALVRSRYIWAWTCQFFYVPRFLARMKRAFDGTTEETAGDLIHQAEFVEFLALDDLGTEKLTPWSSEIITSLINTRYAEKKATAISSNYDLDGLAKRYERIADRIRERAVQIPLLEKRPERT